MSDAVNHPSHYAERVPGVECIEVTEHFDFLRGNAIKYIWRAGSKGDAATELEDLRKAAWYVQRAIEKLQGNGATAPATDPLAELRHAVRVRGGNVQAVLGTDR